MWPSHMAHLCLVHLAGAKVPLAYQNSHAIIVLKIVSCNG